MPKRPAPPTKEGRRGRKMAVAAVSSALRVAERKRVGALRSCLVQPATLRAYTAACKWFFELGLDYGDEVWELDAAIGDAIELAWDTGLSRALVGNLLSGMEHFVNPLRGQFKESWRLWKVWGQREVPSRAPPLSGRAVLGLCWYMWTWGYEDAAVLTFLGFHRFMRTMEFVSLRVSQLTFGSQQVHIALDSSKGAKRRGIVEGVTVDNPWLCGVLHRCCLQLWPGDTLLRLTPRQYRVLFDEAVKALGLGPDFKPYSLRRGGASQYFQRTGNMDVTMEIGRWGNIRTARTYVNVALLELTAMQRLESPTLAAAADAFMEHVVLKEGTTWTAAAHASGRQAQPRRATARAGPPPHGVGAGSGSAS